jgi:predicted O-methyltransferase YrrM
MKKLIRNIYNLICISTSSFIIINYLKNYFFYYRKKTQCRLIENSIYSNFKSLDESKKWFINNLYFLKKNLSNIKINALLEIGSYEGRSALFFANLFKDSQITCVDTWSGSDEHNDDFTKIENNFDLNVNELSKKNKINKIKSTSNIFFDNNNNYYDFIYVDGDHSNEQVFKDLENSWACLNNNGYLLIDDYMWWYYKDLKKNPASAINIFINKNKKNIKKLLIWHQVLIQKNNLLS